MVASRLQVLEEQQAVELASLEEAHGELLRGKLQGAMQRHALELRLSELEHMPPSVVAVESGAGAADVAGRRDDAQLQAQLQSLQALYAEQRESASKAHEEVSAAR